MTLPGHSGLTPRLRVAIDLTPAVQSHAGISRYARELARALVATGGRAGAIDLSAFVVDSEARTPEAPLDALPVVRVDHPNKVWRAQVLAASWLGRGMDDVVGAVDVFHGTDHLLPPLSRTASVLTVHDLSFLHVPETHNLLHRTYLRMMMPRFVRSADAIVTVSEATRRDVLDVYDVSPARVRTVLVGVGRDFGPRSETEIRDVRARYGLPERYVLSVGTLEPRKNLRTLLAAFDAAAVPGLGLALVGSRGWRIRDALGDLARTTSATLESRVLQTGFVPDRDLPALYAGAVAFCFPSLFEGFGSPVLEAMACGAPVIASNTTSLPEVLGDAGILLPPLDLDAWVDALRLLAADADRCAQLGQAGRVRAARFTWENAAAGTLAAYREAHARRA